MKKFFTFIVRTAMILVAVLAASTTAAAEERATLTVTVQDEDRNPVPGATVLLESSITAPTSLITDAEGKVNFEVTSEEVIGGVEFQCTVSKYGYAQEKGSMLFNLPEEMLWVILKPAEASLVVTAKDGDKPVAGATVTFNNNYSDTRGCLTSLGGLFL